MRALALGLALLSLSAGAQDRLSVYPRLDRANRLGGSATPPLLSLSLLSPDLDCSGTPPVGVTFTRASAATCYLDSSGDLPVALSANQARVTSRGLLVEDAATNIVLYSSTPSNAAWTKTGTATCSGDTCTGGASGGDVTQAITTAAATRSTSVYLRAASGSGGCSFSVTRDGSTWASVTASVSAWTRVGSICPAGEAYCVAIPGLTSGIANPIVGARIPAGCGLRMAHWQDEAGGYPTSAIETAGASVTRAGELVTTPTPLGLSRTEGCVAASVIPLWTADPGHAGVVSAGTIDNARLLAVQSWWTSYDGAHQAFGSAVGGLQSRGRTEWSASGNRLQVFNGASAGTATAFSTFPAFAVNLTLGAYPGGGQQLGGWLRNVVLDTTPGGCR